MNPKTKDLNLLEIEALLIATAPREKQDLGKHYDSAKGKLQRWRNEKLAGNAAAVDFVQESLSLFDVNN